MSRRQGCRERPRRTSPHLVLYDLKLLRIYLCSLGGNVFSSRCTLSRSSSRCSCITYTFRYDGQESECRGARESESGLAEPRLVLHDLKLLPVDLCKFGTGFSPRYEKGPSIEGPFFRFTLLFYLPPSTLQIPLPLVEIYRKIKQYITAASPPFMIGNHFSALKCAIQ